jgi:hypothetical protein
MAEIKMAQKSGVTSLVVLGLAILALLIYLLFSYTTLQEKSVARADLSASSLTNTEEGSIKVKEFVAFVNTRADQMGDNPTYTMQALFELTEAINAVAAEHGFNISADLNKVKDDGYKPAKVSPKTKEAGEISKAADILSEALVEMQQARFPTLVAEAGELQKCSASINPGVPIPEQKDALKSYFTHAASLLTKMSPSS